MLHTKYNVINSFYSVAPEVSGNRSITVMLLSLGNIVTTSALLSPEAGAFSLTQSADNLELVSLVLLPLTTTLPVAQNDDVTDRGDNEDSEDDVLNFLAALNDVITLDLSPLRDEPLSKSSSRLLSKRTELGAGSVPRALAAFMSALSSSTSRFNFARRF